jgi:PHD/YefM family antitoxin component YafN of YafNO toxin-antitoxin module
MFSFSSREFSQDGGRAKKAAQRRPVFIIDRGRPTHVLLTIEEYRRITNKQENILDLLGDAGCCPSRI